MFFNKSPEYEKIIFHNAIKTQDGKYFIKFDKEGDEILGQFTPKIKINSIKESSIDVKISKKEHIEFIKEIDDFVVNACKEHKQNWFNNEDITDSYVEQAFMSSYKNIKKSEEITLNLRIAKDIQIFSKSKEEIDLKKINENSLISFICQIEGIWFTKTRFGVTWKIRQIMEHDGPPIPKFGKCLIEDEPEDELDNVFPDQ
tara:strand:- start:16986 stop:17588 length:603 start_codon:yes stop_codon:yes gene_type:complete